MGQGRFTHEPEVAVEQALDAGMKAALEAMEKVIGNDLDAVVITATTKGGGGGSVAHSNDPEIGRSPEKLALEMCAITWSAFASTMKTMTGKLMAFHEDKEETSGL